MSSQKPHPAGQQVFARIRVEAPQRIQANSARLRELLETVNPLDVIAHCVVVELFADPEQYSESTHHGRQAHVECLTLFCLKKPFHGGLTRVLSPQIINALIGLTREICTDRMLYYATEATSENATIPPAFQDLRRRTLVDQLYVRNPGYPQHLSDLLRVLFGSERIATWMSGQLGFSIDTGIRCAYAMTRLVDERFRARRAQAHELERRLRSDWRRYRKSPVPGSVPHYIAGLAKTKERKALREIRAMALQLASEALGDTFTFTANDLAARAAADVGEVEALLAMFSLDFGVIPESMDLPSLTHPLQKRPIVRHPGGFLCPVPSMLLWALRPTIEEAMQRCSSDSSDTIWGHYSARRSDVLVAEGLRHMAGALKGATVYQNLHYNPSEGDESAEAELDGLVLFDRVAFFVEGKAGLFRASARRGGHLSMLQDLRELVAEPHRQAIRAKDFVETHERPAFRLSDGREIEFDKARYCECILVALTLESLDVFVTALHGLRELGVLSGSTLPWAIQILDLRVVCELMEWPSQLIHFLKRRLSLNESEVVVAHDELDWLAQYLRGGLYFEEVVERRGLSRLLVVGCDEIDAYYSFEGGQRSTRVDKPRAPMPEKYRQAINELEAKGGTGYSAVSTVLLDAGWKTKKTISKYSEQIRSRSHNDRRMHNASLGWLDRWGGAGVTLMSFTTDTSREEIMMRLSQFVEIKKYESRASRWVGIATLADRPGVLHAWILAEGDWQEDGSMEERLRHWKSLQR